MARPPRRSSLDALLAAGDALAAAGSLGEVVDAAGSSLRLLLRCERCIVARLAAGTLVHVDDAQARPALGEAELAAAAAALQTREPRFLAQSLAGAGSAASEAADVSALALPLDLASREQGVALCSWPGLRAAPSPGRVRQAELLARLLSLALQRSDALRRITLEADSCDLTGAHSRGSLDTLLAALRARAVAHALVLIDLDGFARYNERRGREAGDRLLVALAGVVARECREGDVVARAGADEFALVLPGSTVEAGAAAVARIVAAVADWGHEEVVTVSAGVAGAIADGGADVLALALGALEQAKAAGEGSIAVA